MADEQRVDHGGVDLEDGEVVEADAISGHGPEGRLPERFLANTRSAKNNAAARTRGPRQEFLRGGTRVRGVRVP